MSGLIRNGPGPYSNQRPARTGPVKAERREPQKPGRVDGVANPELGGRGGATGKRAGRDGLGADSGSWSAGHAPTK